MHYQIQLLTLFLCLVEISGRQINVQDDSSIENHETTYENKREHSRNRHRRKRWQSMGYVYPVPHQPFQPEINDRTEFLLQNILQTLTEIAENLKRPVAPQPIYIPYPLSYPVLYPTQRQCPNVTNTSFQVEQRFPNLEDPNQNWGFSRDNEESEETYKDFSRPLSFDAIPPINIGNPNQKAPDAQVSASTPVPSLSSPLGSSRCETQILSCCNPRNTPNQKAKCFEDSNCSHINQGQVCTKKYIDSLIEKIARTYTYT